ncbi:MAG: hypothetical protein ACR2NU_03945, partial [Aeoliella sp.]
MQPFPVHCETCGAKLKVRDASAVGEIHACPKCDSMVLIAAPAGWDTAAASASVAAPVEATPPGELIVPKDFANEVDDLLQTPTPAEPLSEPTAEQQVSTPEPMQPASTAVVAGKTSAVVWGTAGVV